MKYEINDDSLIINNNLKNNNYQKYRIEKIMKDLNWLNDIDLNKFVLIPYIKIEYFNENNYITYYMKFIEKFNKEYLNQKQFQLF